MRARREVHRRNAIDASAGNEVAEVLAVAARELDEPEVRHATYAVWRDDVPVDVCVRPT